MKNEKWIDVIGGIDTKLVENAEKASGNDAVSSRKARKFTGFKRVAVIAVAVILTVGGLLMLNANVRAAVLGLFVYQDEAGYQRVHFEGSDADVDIHDVTIGYIPEGYVAREMTEDDIGDGYDSRIRLIYLIREEDMEKPWSEMSSTVPHISITINRAGDIDWGYDRETYEMVNQTKKINGMDTWMLHHPVPDFEVTFLMFGDDKITVNTDGVGISIDEVVRVAENISW